MLIACSDPKYRTIPNFSFESCILSIVNNNQILQDPLSRSASIPAEYEIVEKIKKCEHQWQVDRKTNSIELVDQKSEIVADKSTLLLVKGKFQIHSSIDKKVEIDSFVEKYKAADELL